LLLVLFGTIFVIVILPLLTKINNRYSITHMNKLSLVGMQLAEKYKENLDVSSESPLSGVTGALLYYFN
jgi:hypothetical protein